VSRCGYIIPPNLYPKTHVLKKKLIFQPRNNQVQHIVVKVMGGTGERMGKKGNSDLNRSRETLRLSMFASSEGVEQLRGFLRTIAQGCAIVRFLSSDNLIGGTYANDCPRMCDRLRPQNVTFHLSEP
jgi:hypothetical protein